MLGLKIYGVWQVSVIILWLIDRSLSVSDCTRPVWRRYRAGVAGALLAVTVLGLIAWWIASVNPLVRWITAWLAVVGAAVALVTYLVGFVVGVAIESGRWAHRTARHALRRRRAPVGSYRPVGLVPGAFTDVDGVARPAEVPVDLAAELHHSAAAPPP